VAYLAHPASASPLRPKAPLKNFVPERSVTALCRVPSRKMEAPAHRPPDPGWGNQSSGDSDANTPSKKIARFIPKRTDARPADANAKSEIHPITVRDSGRAKLCPGQVWREIRTNEASSWPHDHGRSTTIKDRERAFLLDGCSHRQRDWQARGHFRDFCLQIVRRSHAHRHRGARKGPRHVF
jgi:hypothetical protein